MFTFRARIACVIVLFWSAYGACALVYDSPVPEPNPYDLQGSSQFTRCETCVTFYHVERPIMTGVYHVFVGAEMESNCPLPQKLFAYGALKRGADLKIFQKMIDRRSEDLERRGRACGANGREAIERARNLSAKWQGDLNNFFYLSLRTLITPVMGRACAVAAAEIEEAVRPMVMRTTE